MRPFDNKHDDSERELRFKSLSYQNQTPVPFPKDTELEVEFVRSSTGIIKDFDFEFEIGGKDVIETDYDRERNLTVIEILNPDGTVSKQVFPGIKTLKIHTLNGKLTYQIL